MLFDVTDAEVIFTIGCPVVIETGCLIALETGDDGAGSWVVEMDEVGKEKGRSGTTVQLVTTHKFVLQQPNL